MASSEPISDIIYDRMLWHYEHQSTHNPDFEDDSDYLHGDPFDDHE